ncbi:MAG: isoleucine--tRNA ligase [Acidobacteriota bacterium]
MENEKKFKWKDTLNLPKTNFPMKAQLNRKEPELLKFWDEMDLYNEILKKNSENEPFILHDGPPYANGNIHLGHALNKILKDFIVKTKSMEGFMSPYVPGWDCHGLPIEIKVDKNLGPRKKDMSIPDIRRKCREYAEKYIRIQKEEFKRLGVFGDWDNPYTTINPALEASIIETFKSFVEKGNVIRKKRPVYWCNSCHTALAEAEVEYDEHTSPSIYVKFKLKETPKVLNTYTEKDIFVLIWTTTPWTIPANLAIAVKDDYQYSLFELKGEYYIAAKKLVPLIAEMLDEDFKILKDFEGIELKGLNAEHPLYNRDSKLITTNYVELDQGTGCVHTAPGHGEDDYRAGLEYGLDIYAPVGPTGLFDDTVDNYAGKEIFSSNKLIVEDLRNKGRLLHDDNVTHSYPHCWRCKNPVIFRATEQWFISMDTAGLRQKALKEIKKVNWTPSWGEERIYSMVEGRPDWCISRQRNWGVPLPVFFCKKCNHSLLNTEAIDKVKEQFMANGSDSWYTKDISEFLPENVECSNCGGTEFIKGMDIVDVWFESGSSFGVLEHYPLHQFPADLYLEGGDQYRGWFHSSLLVGISSRDSSPYKSVLTHGWTLDDKGRAMSKSLGNVISPQEIIKDKGAEILRLWVAMVNYKEDTRLSDEILLRVSESYRKIRNTWKFMLGVMNDFDTVKDIVEEKDLTEIDNYIIYKLESIKEKVINSYEHYEFHTIFHTILNFFIVDLSSFYLNIMKDNLYCNPLDSKERRASQTTIFRILRDTSLLLAPILSFTTEEIWENIPEFEGKERSVHLHNFPSVDPVLKENIDIEKWEKIMVIRENILKEIENARNKKIIGDSLESEVNLSLKKDMYSLMIDNVELLKKITVVSNINLVEGDEKIEIVKFEGEKCPRCWNWFKMEEKNNDFPDLCPRCSDFMEDFKFENKK